MKHLLSAAFLVVATFAQAEEPKITGKFESVPLDVLLGLPDSVTKKHKQSLERTRQTIVITEKEISMNAGVGGSISMTYTVQGDFLLGKSKLGTAEMFYPIYVKDAETLYLSGQKFVRQVETAK